MDHAMTTWTFKKFCFWTLFYYFTDSKFWIEVASIFCCQSNSRWSSRICPIVMIGKLNSQICPSIRLHSKVTLICRSLNKGASSGTASCNTFHVPDWLLVNYFYPNFLDLWCHQISVYRDLILDTLRASCFRTTFLWKTMASLSFGLEEMRLTLVSLLSSVAQPGIYWSWIFHVLPKPNLWLWKPLAFCWRLKW